MRVITHKTGDIFVPFPVVWSADGPVLTDDVPPLCLVQSNLSLMSWTKPHIDVSKLQVKPGPEKLKIFHVFNFSFIKLFIKLSIFKEFLCDVPRLYRLN